MIQMYKEYKITKSILEGTGDKLYVVETKDIKGLDIGGIINSFISGENESDLRFESYQIEEEENEVIVLELKKDDDRFFFKPIFSDDSILILSEDYLYDDNLEAKLGEIKTANNRRNISIEENNAAHYYGGMYATPVEEYKELVTKNPLGIYLTSIVPTSALPNNASKMIEYNSIFSKDLAHKISRMKLKSQINICESYEKLKRKSYTK